MSMALTRGEVSVKPRNVEHIVACGIELNLFAGDVKVRLMGSGIANRLAQIKEGLAQVVPRGLLWFIGPKESDECLAAVRAVGFDGKLSEERAGLVRLELRNSTIGQRDLQSTQHAQHQVCHPSSPVEL